MIASNSRRKTTEPAAFAFLAVVLLQGFHELEHVVQVVQRFVFGNPSGAGIVGTWIDIEPVHLVYNGVFLALIGLCFLAGRFTSPLVRHHPAAFGLMAFALASESYHFIEHIFKMAQFIQTGVNGTPGILGHLFNLVLLHFFYNTVAYVPLVAVFILDGYPRGAVAALRPYRAVRAGAVAGGVGVFIVTGGLLWSEHIDAQGRQLTDAGLSISDTLVQLSEGFAAGDAQAMVPVFAVGATVDPWVLSPDEGLAGIERYRFDLAVGPLAEARPSHILGRWRASHQAVDMARFRLLLIEDLHTGAWARAQMRFEVRGQSGDGRRIVDRGVLVGHFQFHGDRWRISRLSLASGDRTVGSGDAFLDLAEERGLGFVLSSDPRADRGEVRLRFALARHAYAGVAAADYDGDGFDDLLFGSGDQIALYRNHGDGSFEDVTERAGLAGLRHVNSAILADLDNDGDPDLVAGVFLGPNRLFRNGGTGVFTDVTEGSGLGPDLFTAAVAVGDLNNDGLLDIYVGQYLDVRRDIPEQRLYARNGEPNRLYLNTGGLVFRDHTDGCGCAEPGLGLSLAIADYDRDGDQDIYVVNDFGRNALLRNRGDATFEDVAIGANALAVGAGMSGQWADYDGDGLLDLYVTGIRSDISWSLQPIAIHRAIAQGIKRLEGSSLGLYWDLLTHLSWRWDQVGVMATSGNYLLKNRGDGSFVDVSAAANVKGQGWYWSAALLDYDNDGDLDLYAVNGFIRGTAGCDLGNELRLEAFARPYQEGYTFSDAYVGDCSIHGYEANTLHINLGDGRYVEAAAALGLGSMELGRGMAISDFDHDGDLDIVVSNYGARPHYFVNQHGSRGHWLQVRLIGRESNRDGIGAVVRVRTGPKWQTRLIAAGEGYASQYSRVAHFGLGAAGRVDELRIWWPSGKSQTFVDLPVNRSITVDEGQPLPIASPGDER